MGTTVKRLKGQPIEMRKRILTIIYLLRNLCSGCKNLQLNKKKTNNKNGQIILINMLYVRYINGQ